MPLYRRVEPNMQLLEFRCNEFAEEFMYGNLRKQPLVKRWEGDTMTIDITRKVPPGDSFYQWYGREDGRAPISHLGIVEPPRQGAHLDSMRRREATHANEACQGSLYHR